MTLTPTAFVETVYFFETKTFNFLATIFHQDGRESVLECEYRFRYFRDDEDDEKNFYYIKVKPGMEKTLRDTMHTIATAGARMYEADLDVVEINGGVEVFADRMKKMSWNTVSTEGKFT